MRETIVPGQTRAVAEIAALNLLNRRKFRLLILLRLSKAVPYSLSAIDPNFDYD